VLIPLKGKYTTRFRPTPKSVKNQKSGNNPGMGTARKGGGRRKAKLPVDWSASTGLGRRS
jgi:hypothetical protein